ncbi:MAG: hypothetical protein IJH75_06800 [Mogibacterium sp.]|nr:hypothetical protein [Mogibacterium sp.]
MLYYLTLFLVFWAILYTVARFFRYFRIVKDYREETTATVVRTREHVPARKKEPPAVDVVLAYTIDGKDGESEIIVPVEHAGNYTVGKTVDICYHVSGNGTVHIASGGDGPKKMMYGYLAAIIIEIIVYFIIWRVLL